MWTREQQTIRHEIAANSEGPNRGWLSKVPFPILVTLLTFGLWVHATPVVSVAHEPAVAQQEAAEQPPSEQPPTDQDATAPEPSVENAQPAEDQESEPEIQTIPIPDHWKRLGKPGGAEVWLDSKNKSVIVGGHVCVTRGGLEMFICPVNTKEHESVIAAHSTAAEVHAALLAIGAEPGKPVQWDPVPKGASGSVIEVRVTWLDPDSKRPMTRWGKELVRNYRDGTGLAHDWVFGGSILERDPESGDSYYYADSGPLLCVSNFATACIDINVSSSAVDGNLLYEAFTENLPPKDTKVYVQLIPGEFVRGK